jgi:hypothetical protein
VRYAFASQQVANQYKHILDYKKLLEILPSSSPLIRDIERSMRLLAPRLEAAQKQETGEMMEKLKGLGNSILGMLSVALRGVYVE